MRDPTQMNSNRIADHISPIRYDTPRVEATSARLRLPSLIRQFGGASSFVTVGCCLSQIRESMARETPSTSPQSTASSAGGITRQTKIAARGAGGIEYRTSILVVQ